MPAYPTTISRSPDTSPEVAYFTSSADLAPSTTGRRQHDYRRSHPAHADFLLRHGFVEAARIESENRFNGTMIFYAGRRVRLVMIHVAGSDDQNRTSLP